MQLSPHQISDLLSKVAEPEGKSVAKKTELVNKSVIKDSLSAELEVGEKTYVKRTQLVMKYELVETLYELY